MIPVIKMFVADTNAVQTASELIGSKEFFLSKSALKFLAYLTYYQEYLSITVWKIHIINFYIRTYIVIFIHEICFFQHE